MLRAAGSMDERPPTLAARGGSLPSPKRAEPARLLRCSSVKYAKYSPSSRLAAGPAAPISARSDFHLGLLVPGRRLDAAPLGHQDGAMRPMLVLVLLIVA